MVRSPRPARSFSTASMRSAASTNAASSSAADESAAAASETSASVESFIRFFSDSAAFSALCAVTLPTATAAACLTHGALSLDNAINDSTCGSIRRGGIFE